VAESRANEFYRPNAVRSATHRSVEKRPTTKAFVDSCPEVSLWDITLSAKSYCGTCPRSRFLGSFTDHFDGLPTTRPSRLVPGHADDMLSELLIPQL